LGDVTHPETLAPALHGVSHVFHLAGVVGHRASDDLRLEQVNVVGAKNLLDAARTAGVERVVFASSVGAMGPASTPEHPRSEAHWLLDGDDGRPDFRYARTKALGEQHALQAAADGLDVVVVNPGFLSGTLRFTVRGGLSYVDVRDVVAGMLLAEQRGVSGERYILSNDEGNLPYA